jgi:hypothetical protein
MNTELILTRDWERREQAKRALWEQLQPVVPVKMRVTDNEIIALDINGHQVGKVVFAEGGRQSLGYGEKWNTQLKCEQTFHVPNLGTI